MDQSNPDRLALRRQGPAREPLWYKDAVIYQLHVKAFFDSNDDGIGDFKGLTRRLDYVKDLGVNTLWLLPFYPSPLKDDGYDIADYEKVHPDYGTIADFKQFIREAHRRGLRVITELVINHTSDQHPWFQAARRAPPGSAKRNYYVWSDTDTKWPETRIIFTDTESSNWTWDPVAKAYYWHRFFSHQPDLNFDNPNVLRAVLRVMSFWFDLGVDGMRLDAIPYLIERDGTNNENLPETHTVLKKMRAALDEKYPDRFFLAEVNQWPEDVREYFGDADECHMAYHFPLMPRIYMAVAEEDRHPIIDIMQQTPDIPASCQWAIFLRNHDELTLEMVTARERDYMYRAYAADKRARINVGIRRRLAPLMEGNRRKIELLDSLLMSLIGSPILYYGDELGMGDNIYLGDRNGVRTPMQWSPDRNAGFSRADPQRLYLPPIMDPVYGFQTVNVEAQSRSPESLLAWTKRLIAVRNAQPAFGRGALRFLQPGNRKVLVYVREHAGDILLCVANLSRSSQPVELDLAEFKGRVPIELLGKTPFPPIGELPYFLTLPPWGFYWFCLSSEASAPAWHEERPARSELPVLVVPQGVRAILAEPGADATVRGANDIHALLATRVRQQLERQVLPAFLRSQRWFAGKGAVLARTEMAEELEWTTPDGTWLLAIARATLDGAPEVQAYSLPLAIAWEDTDYDRVQSLLHCTVARMRQRERVGILYDALWDDEFCRAVVEAMGKGVRQRGRHGELVFSRTQTYAAHVTQPLPAVSHPAFEQSNTLVLFGQSLVLKGYRRLRRGLNPEIEVGRFLTEASPFAHVAPVLGTLEVHTEGREPVALAMLQAYVPNQGNGWSYTLDYLARALEAGRASADTARAMAGDAAARPVDAAEPTPVEEHALYLELVGTLGRRTAELHRALARSTGDVAFEPEPAVAADLDGWVAQVREDVATTFAQLQSRLAALAQVAQAPGAPEAAPLAARLLSSREALLARIDACRPADDCGVAKTRLHGDYHLGQVLIAERDFVIVDFEGEPGRSIAERRAKHSALRDVAGMLRSFSYAAAVALDAAATDRPDDRARLAPYAAGWRQAAESAFLSAYLDVLDDAPVRARTEHDTRALIELFAIEKALYEVRYELANRPAWVVVPVEGLLEILDAPRQGAPA